MTLSREPIEDLTVDYDTGEILEEVEEAVPAEILPAPAANPGSLAIVDADITWNTLKTIAATELVGPSLRNQPAKMLAAILHGRELGLGPMRSLQHIGIVNGRPAVSAEVQLSKYREAGHSLKVDEHTSAECTLTGTRRDNGDQATVSYTLEDALTAGLVQSVKEGRAVARSKNGAPLPWESHTADMLWARAVTRLVRRLAPEVLG